MDYMFLATRYQGAAYDDAVSAVIDACNRYDPRRLVPPKRFVNHYVGKRCRWRAIDRRRYWERVRPVDPQDLDNPFDLPDGVNRELDLPRSRRQARAALREIKGMSELLALAVEPDNSPKRAQVRELVRLGVGACLARSQLDGEDERLIWKFARNIPIGLIARHLRMTVLDVEERLGMALLVLEQEPFVQAAHRLAWTLGLRSEDGPREPSSSPQPTAVLVGEKRKEGLEQLSR